MSRKKNSKDRIICSSCGIEKDAAREYFISYSPFHSHTGRLHICKNCLDKHVDTEDVNSIKDALRRLDKPFIKVVYHASLEESRKTGSNLFRLYMKNISMKQYREMTWADSDDIQKRTEEKEELETNNLDYDEGQINELKTTWGSFSIEDLIWLDNEYSDWVNRYECDSKGMETLIQEICMTKLDIKKRRENGEKVDQQLKTLQDLLGSSNLKPVQETGANAAEQETFGTLIKKFEKERPIPEPDEKWKDVDGIGKYIRTFFLGHMAKAIGVENKFQDEYEKELAKYTVELSESEDEEK